MRLFPVIPVILVLVTAVVPVGAQVPQLLHYQGRVKVSGADFSGTGQFKFALVSGTGTTSFWSNDGTSASGSPPGAAVSLSVQGGLYSVLLGDATLPGMTALTPGVFSNSDVRLRVWFSDGPNGWQQLTPDHRVASVGYALMAEDLKDGAVTSNKIVEGAVTAGKIAAGAVTATALAPDAVTDSLEAAGQGTVPSGAVLISPLPGAPSLLAAGYQPAGTLDSGDSWTAVAGGIARDRAAAVWTGTEMLIWGDGAEGWRYKPSTNGWTAMATVGQPLNRENPVAVWTGTEMLVWGGITVNGALNTGGRYHPASDTWSPMSLSSAPSARSAGTAVWTGSEMIVWGGFNGGALADGGRYTPVPGTGGIWSPLPATSAPVARYWQTAVWDGSGMIIYGGTNGAVAFNDGGRFDPGNGGTWSPLSAGPSPRYYHSAVWTGTGMIVWGGSSQGTTSPIGTGSLYTPSTQTWTSISPGGAPAARFQHQAVWTGSEMIVWGGSTSNVNAFVYADTGASYHPGTGIWTALPNRGAPAGRIQPLMVWSGKEMIVWGGSNGGALNDGGRYRPNQTLYLYQRP